MIAAVYARKSNDQHRLADEAKSVSRQIEHARTYILQKGWTVAEEHVYVDDGISGAIFGEKRPGFYRLLNAVQAGPAFQVLVVMDQSRLGREQDEVPLVLRRITQARVRIFCYLTDTEIKRGTSMEKFQASAIAFVDEMYREQGRQRTRDTMAGKARRGHVAGGSLYGYRNVPVMHGDRRSHAERVIVPEEAAVIRRIFEMAAAGSGYQRIAHRFNEEGVLAPLPRRRGRPRGWAPGTIREMLFRPLYRGLAVYGKTTWVYRDGARIKVDTPESEWITVEAPSLRIIPEPCWLAAHTRLAGTRASYVRVRHGQVGGRPVNGAGGRYLLTGLGQCGICGGGMFVHTRGPWHRGAPSYGCMAYHTRGRVVCPNNLEVPLEVTDRAVLTAVERDVLRVEVLETALAKAMETLRVGSEAGPAPHGMALRDELARLETEVGHLARAIAAGGELPALLALLQERERRRASVRSELAVIDRQRATATRQGGDLRDVLETLRGQLTDWQGLLRQEAPHARQALSALLAGRLIFTPRGDGPGRYYEFAGPGTLRKVIAGLALPMELVPPG